MDSVVETLNMKLNQWKPDVAEQVKHYILEIMEMADQGSLDLARSRLVEQEVLDLLDDETG